MRDRQQLQRAKTKGRRTTRGDMRCDTDLGGLFREVVELGHVSGAGKAVRLRLIMRSPCEHEGFNSD